jgi:hypothetical protein
VHGLWVQLSPSYVTLSCDKNNCWVGCGTVSVRKRQDSGISYVGI